MPFFGAPAPRGLRYIITAFLIVSRGRSPFLPTVMDSIFRAASAFGAELPLKHWTFLALGVMACASGPPPPAPTPTGGAAPVAMGSSLVLGERNFLELGGLDAGSTKTHTANFASGQWGGFTVLLEETIPARGCEGFELQLFGADGQWLMTYPPQLKTVTVSGEPVTDCVGTLGMTVNRNNYRTMSIRLINKYAYYDSFYHIYTH